MATIVTASAIAPLGFNALANVAGSYTNAATIAIVLPAAVGVLAALAPLPTRSRA